MKKFVAIALAAFALTSCSIYDARDEQSPRTTVPAATTTPTTTTAPTTTVAPATVVVVGSSKPAQQVGTKVADITTTTTAAVPVAAEQQPVVKQQPAPVAQQPAPVAAAPEPVPVVVAVTEPPVVVIELPDNSCIMGVAQFNPACPGYVQP